MLIIFNKKLSSEKKLISALTEVYGLGWKTSIKICKILSLPLKIKTQNLTKTQIFKVTNYIKKNCLVEVLLKNKLKTDLQKHLTNGSIKGFRHKHGLPVRGQRTHSNAKTKKKFIIKNIKKKRKKNK